MQTGTLYLVPNMLGLSHLDQAHLNHPHLNHPLCDVIPIEVQKITSQLTHFVVENAKTTRAFLKLIHVNFPLAKPLQEIQMAELNVHTNEAQLSTLLAPLLAGHDVGLISEAGVPAVADPGANLVRLAHQRNIVVRPLVGPSSLLLAIMASGLNGQSFAFHGYLPTHAALRSKRLQELEQGSRKENQTQLFIETPYRNRALLEAICAGCHSDTQLCLATDLTLVTESIHTWPVSYWKTLLSKNKAPDINKKPTVFLLLA